MPFEKVPDLKTLSRGWDDWILFAEIEEDLRSSESSDVRTDSINWAVLHADAGYVRAGTILSDRIEFWSESGFPLSRRIEAWMLNAPPEDPLKPVMTLFFELTDSGRNLIPDKLKPH